VRNQRRLSPPPRSDARIQGVTVLTNTDASAMRAPVLNHRDRRGLAPVARPRSRARCAGVVCSGDSAPSRTTSVASLWSSRPASGRRGPRSRRRPAPRHHAAQALPAARTSYRGSPHPRRQGPGDAVRRIVDIAGANRGRVNTLHCAAITGATC
jgi:hypothetical protein